MGELINKINQIAQIKEDLRTTLGLSSSVPFDQFKDNILQVYPSAWSTKYWQSIYNYTLSLARSDWKSFPSISTGEEVIYYLVNVIENTNDIITLDTITTSLVGYIVDWGDGTIENIASGSTSASHTYDFSDVDLGTDLTDEGYKQAIIKITPQTVDDHLLTQVINDNLKKFVIKASFNVPYMTSCSFQGYSILKEISLNENSITSFTNMFYECSSLKSISYLNTSAGTSFDNMFVSCGTLQTIPLIDTSGGTNFTNMFANCVTLQTIPLIDTSNGTTFTGMFESCTSLINIPLIDTNNGTTFTSMFQSCSSLQTIPLLNTSSGTNFTSMFAACSTLKTIPLLDTSSGTNFTSMFSGCTTLQTVPLLNTSSGTNFTDMFNGIELFYGYFIGSCVSLINIPELDLSSATSCYNMFYGCSSLRSSNIAHTKTISYENCNLSSDALDYIYTNLATLTNPGDETITVSGNPGTSGDDPSIATAKNWTVTG